MLKRQRIKRFIYTAVFPLNKTVSTDNGIISFSFDDVPRTGVTQGAKLLERHNINGSFYISAGMFTRKDEDSRLFANEDDIIELHHNGHHIGCHSFSHGYQSKQSTCYSVADCKKNRTLLENITKSEVHHYSYPFGDISLLAKRKLRHQYRTMRSIMSGINYGRTDMSCLKAVSIASINLNKSEVLRLIKEAQNRKGWLIFFTHDVCQNPAPWGTTIDDFEWVIQSALESRCEILPVDKAYDAIANSGQS